MQRVLVIGSPGSGKSTVATELARLTGLPLIHLDQQYWREGWVEPAKDEWNRRLTELAARDCWVMDGNYGGSLAIRLERADTVVDLRMPAWLCVWRILRRLSRSWGRVRPDMADGCPEQLNLGFLFYTATFPFSARKRADAKLERFRGTHVKLVGSAEVRRFLAIIGDAR